MKSSASKTGVTLRIITAVSDHYDIIGALGNVLPQDYLRKLPSQNVHHSNKCKMMTVYLFKDSHLR